MLRQRVLVAAVLLPIGLIFIYLGGIPFAALIALILVLAGWEYAKLFEVGEFQPSAILVVGGILLLAAARYFGSFESSGWVLAGLILLTMTYHMVAYERGRDLGGSDFAVTISGILYIGWLGAYLISLRELEGGLWWVLLALPSVWIADSGAYFLGKRFGKRKLSPRLSPKKTWEGYWAGVVTGTLGGALLAWLWQMLGSDASVLQGAVLGLVVSLIAPLGDLGESMIKRQVGIKDSSNLIPGHGGAFDRIDSWLWAGVIGYYMIVWFF